MSIPVPILSLKDPLQGILHGYVQVQIILPINENLLSIVDKQCNVLFIVLIYILEYHFEKNKVATLKNYHNLTPNYAL